MLNVYHYHTNPTSLLHHKTTKNPGNIHENIPHHMMTYYEAAEFIDSLNVNGATGWRLPTVREMQSILAEAVSPGTKMHPNLPHIDFYWTSNITPDGGVSIVMPFDAGDAEPEDLAGFFEWAGIEDLTDVEIVDKDKGVEAYVYPVRGELEPFVPVSQRDMDY